MSENIITRFSDINMSFCGFGREGTEKKTWRVSISSQHRLSHLPTCLPAAVQPTDKRSGSQNQVWKEEVRRKEVVLWRGRKGDTEGGEKVRDTGGFIVLPEIRRVSTQMVWQSKPRRRREINQQPSLYHCHIFARTTVDILTSSTPSRDSVGALVKFRQLWLNSGPCAIWTFYCHAASGCASVRCWSSSVCCALDALRSSPLSR